MIESTYKLSIQELTIMNVQDLKLLGIMNATAIICTQINIKISTNIKMTLDEAIEHCLENAKGNDQCSLEHKQLAEWLIKLKNLSQEY